MEISSAGYFIYLPIRYIVMRIQAIFFQTVAFIRL